MLLVFLIGTIQKVTALWSMQILPVVASCNLFPIDVDDRPWWLVDRLGLELVVPLLQQTLGDVACPLIVAWESHIHLMQVLQPQEDVGCPLIVAWESHIHLMQVLQPQRISVVSNRKCCTSCVLSTANAWK